MNYYAGVGSRVTPLAVMVVMKVVAAKMHKLGWTLRSGGAQGADKAFESGAPAGCSEIYRPRGESNWMTRNTEITVYGSEIWEQAMEIARLSHPAWGRCPAFARALHARNAFQVLGKDLATPSKSVICWTRDGAENAEQTSIATGGTGTAIRIASANGIEVVNMGNAISRKRIVDWAYNNVKT